VLRFLTNAHLCNKHTQEESYGCISILQMQSAQGDTLNSAAKILIVDDHAILRAGIRSLLTTVPGLEVTGEADNGKDAISHASQFKPDIVICDLSMPGTNGTEAIQRIKSRNPDIKILVLTVHNTEEQVHNALKAGANGYVLKDDSSEELFLAINNILAGKTHLSSSICGDVVTGYLDRHNDKKNYTLSEHLTTREREVVKLVSEGYRNKDIAEYLSINLKTVEKHRSNMMKKLNLHNASGIVNYALKNKIISQ
jgi:DNA-binding NarL/FixJ family response regulator